MANTTLRVSTGIRIAAGIQGYMDMDNERYRIFLFLCVFTSKSSVIASLGGRDACDSRLVLIAATKYRNAVFKICTFLQRFSPQIPIT